MNRNLALTMLAREGIAAIWQFHLFAARPSGTGTGAATATIIEIADAAGARMAAGEWGREIAG